MTSSNHGDHDRFRRPIPQFGNSNPGSAESAEPEVNDLQEINANSDMQLQAASGDGHIATDIDLYEAYSLSVKDIRSRLFEIGIPKSKDSIQRYCREGMLDCVKLGMLRRYYVTEASVEALIETLTNDEASLGGIKRHEAERSGKGEPLLPYAAAPDEDAAEIGDLHEAASNRMQVDAVAQSGEQPDRNMHRRDGEAGFRDQRGEAAADLRMVAFLKDQLQVKDEQIRVKDEQIGAMLERDRETNILIRGLQDRIGDAFGLLVGAGKEERDPPADNDTL